MFEIIAYAAIGIGILVLCWASIRLAEAVFPKTQKRI